MNYKKLSYLSLSLVYLSNACIVTEKALALALCFILG